MTSCIMRKFILKQINKMLDDYKDNVETSRKNVKVWLDRAETITKFLNMLSAQLEDGNISEDELKETVEGLKNIVQTW